MPGTRMIPVVFAWDAERKVMVPVKHYLGIAARQFIAGEMYPLTVVARRSKASHNQYFAAIEEAFQNLPEQWAQKFPTSEHMRKWILVQVGCCDLTENVFDTPRDAKLFAAMARKFDEYCVIKVSGNVVQIFKPWSQSESAMPQGADFQDAKKKVLDFMADVIGTTRREIEKSARRYHS